MSKCKNASDVHVDKELDVKGLPCPLGILRAMEIMISLKYGEVLKIISSDAASLKIIKKFCTGRGNSVFGIAEEEGTYTFLVQKRRKKK